MADDTEDTKYYRYESDGEPDVDYEALARCFLILDEIKSTISESESPIH
jgi:hypothetical protein